MKRAEDLDNILHIACSDGNWNYSEYHFGMANGLILAHAIINNIEPKFLEKPKEWLEDKTIGTDGSGFCCPLIPVMSFDDKESYENAMNILGDYS